MNASMKCVVGVVLVAAGLVLILIGLFRAAPVAKAQAATVWDFLGELLQTAGARAAVGALLTILGAGLLSTC